MARQQFQIDAFSDRIFGGNPAAVVPLEDWMPDAVMQAIATENQLSETAFFVPGDEAGHYRLRWFTPGTEVDLCGHATLATAHALWRELGETAEPLRFATRSGELRVTRDGALLWMDFPARPAAPVEAPAALAAGLGTTPEAVLAADDWVAVYADAETVRRLTPDMNRLRALDRRGVIATAPADGDADFVSRFFAPRYGIDEDPVTGSAHCTLAPYWSERLKRARMEGHQISSRGGRVVCEHQGERVHLGGEAVTFLAGTLRAPEG